MVQCFMLLPYTLNQKVPKLLQLSQLTGTDQRLAVLSEHCSGVTWRAIPCLGRARLALESGYKATVTKPGSKYSLMYCQRQDILNRLLFENSQIFHLQFFFFFLAQFMWVNVPKPNNSSNRMSRNSCCPVKEDGCFSSSSLPA